MNKILIVGFPHKITLTDNYIKCITDLKTYNAIYKTS